MWILDYWGVQGKPETPAPGPNHTGGDQTGNPNPGGGTTTTPNDGPKGGLGPNGKPIADPSDTTTVTPIPEPQGPQLVLSENKNGGGVSALPGAAPGVNEIKEADALADNDFNVVHQPTNSSQISQDGKLIIMWKESGKLTSTVRIHLRSCLIWHVP